VIHQPLKTTRCIGQAKSAGDPFILATWSGECGFVLIPFAYTQLVEA